MPDKASAPWYPNFPNPEDGLRYVIKALTDQKDAIAALNVKHAVTETRITNVVQEQSTVAGKLPTSVAARAGYFLDSYDANTGGFTSSAQILTGTSGSLGGAPMLAGARITINVTVTGATTAMVATCSPVADPGGGFIWHAFVVSADTVTVCLTCVAAGTPVAGNYNVRVIL